MIIGLVLDVESMGSIQSYLLMMFKVLSTAALFVTGIIKVKMGTVN